MVGERNRDFTYINCYLSRYVMSRTAIIRRSTDAAEIPRNSYRTRDGASRNRYEPNLGLVSESQRLFFVRSAGRRARLAGRGLGGRGLAAPPALRSATACA